MPNTKMLLLGSLLVAAIVCTALPGQAAVNDKDKVQKPVEKAPIVVEGDELYFSDSTGDLFAKGNVVVTQGQAKVLGDVMRGNAKQNEIWIDDAATFTEPGTRLVGTTTRYNYGTGNGTMEQASGKVDRELVAGEKIEFYPQEIIIHNGTETGCPAKVPDYHVSADKIEIWPGDKMIAYNAKFWIKDKIIFSMPKYQTSLRPGAESEFPRLGYNSKDGFSITQHLEYPIDNKVSVYTDIAYYTIRGFQPAFGVTDHEKNYTMGLVDGYSRDVNGNWIKREPEFDLSFGHPVGSLPIDYTFTAVYGKWDDDVKTSWHQDYNLNFAGHPIKLGNTLQLALGTGVEYVHESNYNGLSQSQGNTIMRYSGTLYKTLGPKLNTWATYTYTQNFITSAFAYNAPVLARELDNGITYKIDSKNTVQFIQTYDLDLRRAYDQDYYWIHDIHCWTATIEYRAKRKQTIIDFTTKKF